MKASYEIGADKVTEPPKEHDPDAKPSPAVRAKKLLRKRIPITKWISSYKVGDLIADAIAGITVGLTVVPQSMAYAAIAGLSPEYGLYSSYIGCLLYVILGSCRQSAIGPTAVMGLLTFQTCGNNYPACAVLTGFYSGVFELLMAALQLGWVVSFISEPVTIGFTAGAATTIISSQIKNLFGIHGPKGSGFLGYWESVFQDIETITLADSVMGILCFIALMLLRKLPVLKISQRSKVIKKTLWLISVSRNVIIVVVTTIISNIWTYPPYKIVGTVQGGFPPVDLPQFLLPKQHNSTHEDGETYSFRETWQILGTGPVVIALIAVLQNVAISKTFGSGQSVDATQEMYALGTSNVVGGFLSAIPTSGSFSRSAVNEASGVRSPMGGLFTGVLVLFALNFLAPSFYYIPKASLAAVIISAVMFMIEFDTLKPMWRISRLDLIACIITYVTCLSLGMEYGIIIGVAISTGSILMHMLHPKVSEVLCTEDVTKTKYFIVTPESGMIFPSVDFVRTRLQKLGLKHKRTIRNYFLNFENWTQLDYTAATALVSLVKGFEKTGKDLRFVNVSDKWIELLQSAGMAKPPVLDIMDVPDFIRKTMTTVIVNVQPADVTVTPSVANTSIKRTDESLDNGSLS